LLLAFFKILLLVLTLCCTVLYMPFFAREKNKWEYAILLLIITIAMLLLISTIDLFIAFVALEVQALTLYIMIGLKRYSNLSMEAAQKFFFFAAFSSACFAIGLSILYGITGATNIYHLSHYFQAQSGASFFAILGALLIFISLLFKLTLIPFHFWVGDVFQGSYGYFNSYLAIVSKLPVLILLFKFWYWTLLYVSPYFLILLKILSLASIAVGAIYAFTEINFKRFWALSSIVNLGYITLALSLGTPEGLVVSLVYLVLYLLNTFFVWVFVIHLEKKPTSDFSFNEFLTKLINWAGLFQQTLLTAAFFSSVLFSLGGLPPGAAFLPKAMLFMQLYMFNDFFLLFIIFTFNCLSMAYYIRLARFVLFPSPNTGENKPLQESFKPFSSPYIYFLIVIFLLNLFVMFLFADVVVSMFQLCAQFTKAP
jgi:NADH-quinone oxidoreductase subunit N